MPEVLRGDLSAIRLPTLLQLAEAERLSGWLELGPTARIVLVNGAVTEATCGPLQGVLALQTLFFVPDGTFVLKVGSPEPRPELVPMLRALLEGMRLLDEWARIGPLVLAPTGALPAASAEAQAVLAKLDAKASLQEIVLEAALSPAAVVDPLLALLEQGLLREVAPPKPSVPWPGPAALSPGVAPRPSAAASFEDALALGRRHLREGRLEAAEAAFQHAAALRPDDPIPRQNLRRVQQIRAEGGEISPLTWLRARPRAV